MRNGDQVHMIRHKAVTQQGESVKLRVRPQQFKISDALRIAGKNYLSRVPPLSNMVGNVDDHDTRQPSHRKNLTGMTQSAHGNGLDLPIRFPDGRK